MMYRKFIFIIYIFLILFISGNTYADFNISDWKYCKNINGKPTGVVSYISLDTESLLNSSAGYSDLRIIDSNGKETPYKIIQLAGGEATETIRPAILNRTSVPGKYSSVTLDLNGKKRSNRISIDTSDVNFMCRVEISGSYDGSKWEILRNDAYIFVFSKDVKAKSLDISYPECDFNILKVRIFADNKKVINAANVTVYWKRSEIKRNTVLYDGRGNISENSKDKTTEISFKLIGKNLPSGNIKIFTKSSNYRRMVDVMGSPDAKTWNQIGSGYLLKYDSGYYKEDISSISFNNNNCDHIKIIIRNSDNEPLSVSRIIAQTPERRLAFIPKSRNTYKLYYGNSDAMYPTYDIESLYDYISDTTDTGSPFVLGVQENNDKYAKKITTGTWLKGNTSIIWAIMIAVMAILVVFVIKLARQIKSSSSSDQ